MSTFNPSTRFWLKSAVAAGVGGGLASLSRLAAAQGAAIVEGTQFRAINPAQPTEAPDKIEVIEFFWFGCPHCAMLEPVLREWVRKLPSDVAFRKVHVPFNEVKHQQLYYALVNMGKADDATLEKIFDAIHKERNHLDTVGAMTAFMPKLGIDAKAFKDSYESFAVTTLMRKATAMASAYKVDSVPMLAINGKYMTAPSMAGSTGGALMVAEQLIQRERKARG